MILFSISCALIYSVSIIYKYVNVYVYVCMYICSLVIQYERLCLWLSCILLHIKLYIHFIVIIIIIQSFENASAI